MSGVPFAERDADWNLARSVAQPSNVLIGSTEGVVETLYSRRETLGVDDVTGQQSKIESIVPVVDPLQRR
jgi:hypothetical protein